MKKHRAGKRFGGARSTTFRVAVRDWLEPANIQRFEVRWIAASRNTPEDPRAADAWLRAQQWDER